MGSRWFLACAVAAAVLGGLALFRSARPRTHVSALAPSGLVPSAPEEVGETSARFGDGHADGSSPGRVPAIAESSAVVPRAGAWLRGRLTSADRSTWYGYRLGLTSTDPSGDSEAARQRADLSWLSIRDVAEDGRFELGPFLPGPARVDLYLPVELVWRETSEGDWNRLGIGDVELEEGVVVERDFEVSGRPGELEVEVRVNGEAQSGLEVQVVRYGGCSASGLTDPAGRFGPYPTLPGSVRVWVHDPETSWRHVHPVPIVVEPGATTHALVSIEVVTARVVFVARASGEPLAHRWIAVLDVDGSPLSWSNPTDDRGAASFALIPGEYRFALNPGDTPSFALESAPRSDVIPWSYQGPLVAHVSL